MLCPHCIYVFCIFVRKNSDLYQLYHKLIGFYNRDKKCLQRGTNWDFKLSSLSLVFKGLIVSLHTGLLSFQFYIIVCISGLQHTATYNSGKFLHSCARANRPKSRPGHLNKHNASIFRGFHRYLLSLNLLDFLLS